jgi:indole-3-glycerol phosphate synthase
VAESGISSRADVEAAAAAGADAVLVGESLVRSDDPAAMVAGLLGLAQPRLNSERQGSQRT